jgi:NAD-dependent deacetylase
MAGIMTQSRRGPIVILTGAGISKESGLDTFRDADGIWARVRIEDVATPEAFARDPAGVHAFYNARRRRLLSEDIGPNAAHRALAELEARWPAPVLLVTQNIDDLHERAGHRKLIHMHGELLKARCAFCGDVRVWRDDLSVALVCDRCGRGGGLRPHVVWFGEVPLEMEAIFGALSDCALFVSIGTSGHVYPAAGFVSAAASHGAETVEVNLEPSAGTSLFDVSIQGPASVVVPAFVQRLLAA